MVACVRPVTACFNLPQSACVFLSSICKTIADILKGAFVYLRSWFTKKPQSIASHRRENVSTRPFVYTRNIENWLKRYRSGLVERFNQGPANVCYALCYRLGSAMLKNPLKPVKVGSILPGDRFLQAATLVDFNLFQSMGDLPAGYLRKKGFKEEQLFTAVEKNSMAQKLVKHLLAARPRNALFILHRAVHTTLIRFDTRHRRFFFFDPNFGTIAFSQRPRETDRALARRIEKCWSDLYAIEYDRTGKSPLVCNQLEEIF